MTAALSPLHEAQRLAEELLFPTALATDAADRVPRSHLDALASAGLYGLFGPIEAVIEALAGGCLTTTFVWLQHHSALEAVAASTTAGLRDRWLEPMCLGKWRAGIAIARSRPGAVAVSATAVDGGWRLNGDVPWVTGWGLVDVIHTAATGPGGDVVWALADAVESPSLTCERLHLVAVNASATVTVRFRDHFVPAERVTGIASAEAWARHDAGRLRANGSLALGVIGRCCSLMGPGPLDQQLAACRRDLDDAAQFHPEAMPGARSAASHLAYQAAGALVAATGSRSVLRDHNAQRLVREAAFLLVFGSRPGIRKELRQLFDRPV